ncbi:hypothetical protein [Streptomyces anulatus]|uniref:hypothetical protein n=1 Tax=Streptomyces anulatus TaxID=1892 RepID=UPI00068BFA8E|nr:hypothetical protein [Streptomyces anulatus]
MGFDEEWAQLRAEATQRQATSMQLNGVPDEPGPGPGNSVLASTPQEKAAASRTIQDELLGSTTKAMNTADESSKAAAREFADWVTGPAVKKLDETWDKQVKTLMSRLQTERDGLSGTAKNFAGLELDVRSQFKPLLISPYGPGTSVGDGKP